jgi:hypothetical protein
MSSLRSDVLGALRSNRRDRFGAPSGLGSHKTKSAHSRQRGLVSRVKQDRTAANALDRS